MVNSIKIGNSNRILLSNHFIISTYSVEGFSLDYLMLNLIGYTFYGIYSSIGYFTNTKGAGTVVLADLIFVYHAIPIVIL